MEGSAEAPPAHDSEVAERNRDRLTRILENLENLPPSDSTALPPVEAQDLPTGPEPEKPIAVGGVPAVDQAAGKTAFAADPLEGSAEAPPAHDSEVAERNRERNRLTRILENLENLPPDQVRYPEAFELLAKHLRSVLTPSHLGQTVREETRRLAEQVAYVLSLPHHGAWGLHDVLTGQDSDLSPTERSFDVLGTFPLANRISTPHPHHWAPGHMTMTRLLEARWDWLSAGLAPAEVVPAHLAAKVPAQALELGRSTLAKLSRLFKPRAPGPGDLDDPRSRTRRQDLSEGRPQPHSQASETSTRLARAGGPLAV